ncbi:vWA domain-containing protein [Sessilibacter corallicola]|uniref:VWFA domain-containing protein n=1 Tax=Sessilibacter corallicola TaxID=2904075 RepID=A0ABQ0A4D1_9GAMM
MANYWFELTRLTGKGCYAILVAVVLFASISIKALAQTPADVRLVVDISGSMKKNDPANLRQPAVDLLVKLLPEESKAGVWTFGQYVNMLVPHKTVDGQWAAQAQASSSDINSVGLYTNIGEALEKAAFSVNNATDDYQTSIILLTDGMVDINKNPDLNQNEWRRIADEVIPRLKNENIKVHTIALSENADTTLLNKLAISTGGKAAIAETADELMKAFLGAFDQAVPSEQLPLADNNSFTVDSSVEEFTALIFKQTKLAPAALIGPDESRYDATIAANDPDIKWHSTIDYELITVKRPLEGEWIVDADIAPDSRITVVSNLNLSVKPIPANVYTSEIVPVSAALQEDGKAITDLNFLRVLDVSTETFYEEERWVDRLSSQLPLDGIYQSELEYFSAAGEYKIVVTVDGKSFQRKSSHTITVRDAFATEIKAKNSDSNEFLLKVTPYLQTLSLKDTSVIARIKNPSGQSSITPLTLAKNDTWNLNYSAKEEGLYEVSFSIDMVDLDGQSSRYEPKTTTFSYPEGKFSEQSAQAEPAAKPSEPEEEKPEEEPKAKGTPWWVYVVIGIGNVIIIILGFIAYKLLSGSKSDDGLEEESDKKPAKKEKPKKKSDKKKPEKAAETAEPAATASSIMAEISDPDEPLAMADIGDDLDALISGSDDEVSSDDSASDADSGSDDDVELESSDEFVAEADESDSDAADGMDISSDEGIGESIEDELPEAPLDDLDALLADATGSDGDPGEFTLDDIDPAADESKSA